MSVAPPSVGRRPAPARRRGRAGCARRRPSGGRRAASCSVQVSAAGRVAGQRRGQARARALVLGVRLGEGAALDRLRGLGDRQVAVAVDLDQGVVERVGRVDRVHAPAPSVPQPCDGRCWNRPERVAVAVVEVAQLATPASPWPARSSRRAAGSSRCTATPAMSGRVVAPARGRQRPAVPSTVATHALGDRRGRLRPRRANQTTPPTPDGAATASATTTARRRRVGARRRDDGERSVVGVQGRVELDARARARDRLDRAGQRVAAEEQPSRPDSSRALTTVGSSGAETVTFVPAVT